MAIGLNTNHLLDFTTEALEKPPVDRLIPVGQTDCEYCDGEGVKTVEREREIGLGCRMVEVECTDCFGHGKELCQHCGERPSEFRFNYRVGSQELGSDFICRPCSALPIYGGTT